jgi:hypothetical protein
MDKAGLKLTVAPHAGVQVVDHQAAQLALHPAKPSPVLHILGSKPKIHSNSGQNMSNA